MTLFGENGLEIYSNFAFCQELFIKDFSPIMEK